jgi:aspartate aminotransferase-like enzyme
MKKSMELIEREGGLLVRDARHRKHAEAFQAALEALGFTLMAEPGCRAVNLSNPLYFEGIDDAKFRSTLAEEGVVTGRGLAGYMGKMFRIGHMGNINVNDEVAVLAAIERTLERLGFAGKLGVGVSAYLSKMA